MEFVRLFSRPSLKSTSIDLTEKEKHEENLELCAHAKVNRGRSATVSRREYKFARWAGRNSFFLVRGGRRFNNTQKRCTCIDCPAADSKVRDFRPELSSHCAASVTDRSNKTRVPPAHSSNRTTRHFFFPGRRPKVAHEMMNINLYIPPRVACVHPDLSLPLFAFVNEP